MKDTVKKINLVYENCDVISISYESIRSFNIDIDNICVERTRDIYDARYVYLNVNLLNIDKDTSKQLLKRKDLVYIDLCYESGDVKTVSVPYPLYYISWTPNPYQDNIYDKFKDYLVINIKKHVSILSIKQRIKDCIYYLRVNTFLKLNILWNELFDSVKSFLKYKN